jgi:hypothetical protein
MPRWAKGIACALLLVFAPVGTLRAQHASDDPVASANDAFGLTLGLESIGIYKPRRCARLQPADGR